MSERKGDHLNLAIEAQVGTDLRFPHVNYEPLFCGLSQISESDISINFLNKTMQAPLWISSMTGGTSAASHINHNLARVCNEFGLGMGLGSCRTLLNNEKSFEDFNLRHIIGDDLPFYANFGIAQIEQALADGSINEMVSLVESLKCDGLIVHINPLQEWYQTEGDKYARAPIDTLIELLDCCAVPVIVKEVGQGFGPRSLRALMELPFAAIDFAAFGGTNFTLLEMMRSKSLESANSLSIAHIGHSAENMISTINGLIDGDNVQCKEFIISGGIKNYVDGYALSQRLNAKCVYGHAKAFLEHATGDYSNLKQFVHGQVEGLKIATNFLEIVE